jgi:hypothetical protein
MYLFIQGGHLSKQLSTENVCWGISLLWFLAGQYSAISLLVLHVINELWHSAYYGETHCLCSEDAVVAHTVVV